MHTVYAKKGQLIGQGLQLLQDTPVRAGEGLQGDPKAMAWSSYRLTGGALHQRLTSLLCTLKRLARGLGLSCSCLPHLWYACGTG